MIVPITAMPIAEPKNLDDFVNAMKSAWYVGAGMLAAGWIICQLFIPGGTQEDIE